MNSLVPLKLIFVQITDKDGNNIKTHVAFYDLFGGIAEVVDAADNLQPKQAGPELIMSPINKYADQPHEVVTLWIPLEQKEKIGQTVRDMFDKNDPLAMIFSGKQIDAECKNLTDTIFCLEALRAALPILPDNIPANCVSTQKLYTVLKMLGGI